MTDKKLYNLPRELQQIIVERTIEGVTREIGNLQGRLDERGDRILENLDEDTQDDIAENNPDVYRELVRQQNIVNIYRRSLSIRAEKVNMLHMFNARLMRERL